MKKRVMLIEIFILMVLFASFLTAGLFCYFKLFVEPNIYTIHFDDIDGITKGSAVRFMGINVGYVRNLKSFDEYIDVQILITKKGLKIPNGTLARVEFYGLGGSKSIELKPSKDPCDVGISTGETIRLDDVVHQALSLVKIVEMFESFTKGINKASIEIILDRVQMLKGGKIETLGDDFNTMTDDITKKSDLIRKKQQDVNSAVEDFNFNVEKINRFIKK